MVTLDQVAAQIRFQLEQLSTLNAHHDFEHLCRHLARERICSNILPATGPVSAFGDQGRDFESFRTYLHDSSISNSTFIGLAVDKPVAFACTLTQKKDLITKIKSDIATIMDPKLITPDIHYFCTSDLTVGQRHDLQTITKAKYDIHLEIYDGQAVSELLCDRDVFWIANRYLNIPSEIYPPSPSSGEKGWYNDLFEAWKQAENPPSNFADFAEIKSAIRHATFTEAIKQDLPLWIGLFELIIVSNSLNVLKHRAIYEVAVASLRGLGTLEGQEDRLREYFNEAPTINITSDIEDAFTLLNYCEGAHLRNLIQIHPNVLKAWKKSIIEKLETELKDEQNPNRRCILLQIQGFQYLFPSSINRDNHSIENALQCWMELLNIVDSAPLFPLEDFADRLTKLIELFANIFPLADNPFYNKLIHQVDQLLTKRYGGFIAAQKCRDRAVAFNNLGDILHAIKQLHQSKIKWFAEETLKGSILSMLFLSNCYQKLGLTFAAKYYSLISAYTAINSPDDNIRRYSSMSIIKAALCDYHQGSWCGYFDLTDVGLSVFSAFGKETDPTDIGSEINLTLFHSTTIHALMDRLNPEMINFVEDRVANWNLDEEFEELIKIADETWESQSIDDIWKGLEEQIIGRPFADILSSRKVIFKALGITWTFRWDNYYDLTVSVEQFIAVLQIVLADIAPHDLCLLPTEVEIQVKQGKNANDIAIESLPSNERSMWELRLPVVYVSERLEPNIIAIATTLLFNASVLPREPFMGIMEDAFREGLPAKAFFSVRYEQLYREFVTKDKFERTKRRSNNAIEPYRDFHPVLHHQLEWIDSPGPGYSPEEARKSINRRYEKAIIPIRYTLGRLTKIDDFQETVQRLREDGWLDWHILLSVMNATSSYRFQQEIRKFGIETATKKTLEFLTQPEDDDAEPIPYDVFSEERLRFHQRGSMPATIKGEGLELHQETPDFVAISKFLGARYRYWEDDVDHKDFGF